MVCPGHYKVTIGHHLLLRSPKGSLKHWVLLITSIVPGGLSSGKVERANQFLKSLITKITPDTSLGWKEALPIALLHTHIASKEQLDLSPYGLLYGRHFVYINDLFLIQRLRPSGRKCHHGHWAIPTRNTLVGFQPGPKRF